MNYALDKGLYIASIASYSVIKDNFLDPFNRNTVSGHVLIALTASSNDESQIRVNPFFLVFAIDISSSDVKTLSIKVSSYRQGWGKERTSISVLTIFVKVRFFNLFSYVYID